MTNSAVDILLVEDNQANLALVQAVLEHQPYTLYVARSLARARELVDQQIFTAILLDIELPDGNGLELAVEIKARPATARTTVIAFSASVLPSVQRAALQAGCDLFIEKPIRVKTFLQTLADAIGTRQDVPS